MVTELKMLISILALDVAYKAAQKCTCVCGMPATSVNHGIGWLVCDGCVPKQEYGQTEDLRNAKLVRRLVSIHKQFLQF